MRSVTYIELLYQPIVDSCGAQSFYFLQWLLSIALTLFRASRHQGQMSLSRVVRRYAFVSSSAANCLSLVSTRSSSSTASRKKSQADAGAMWIPHALSVWRGISFECGYDARLALDQSSYQPLFDNITGK